MIGRRYSLSWPEAHHVQWGPGLKAWVVTTPRTPEELEAGEVTLIPVT